MDKSKFYKELLEELEFEEISFLDDETEFKNLDEWDSMSVLITINFCKLKLGIDISTDRLNQCSTFGELLP